MDELVAQYLEQVRLRLLDLSGRNRLLNFKFSERSRTQVRFVDELPDQVFEELERGTKLTIASLPEPPDHPRDEEDDAFRLLLEAMRDTDEEYLTAVAALDETDRDSEEFQRIERRLRDKVREELEMPPRTDLRSLSTTDYANHLGINPSYELPTLQSDGAGQPAHRDKKLQTLLYPNELARKLAGLREGARKSIEESGLNTLYLAFGMLEWYEAEQSDRRLLAPLLLYPVTLERTLRSGQYFYTIRAFDAVPEQNFSLRERLRRDYGIEIPTFIHSVNLNGQAADTPESYFQKIQDIIRDRPRWRVRRFLTLSLFSFRGIALFHDLNPERWPGASILRNQLISSILCGQETASQDAIALDYDVDNPTIANRIPLLITDADASQFSAIVDVIDGKNLVIEGPPGTGKSQTITNLIAAALAQGRKVLFLADKKAALEVVYNRLANAGLENYCLEAHSTAIARQSFYEQIKRRVEQEPPLDISEELRDKINECSQLKQQLSRYVMLLNQPAGRIGKTIQEVFWSYQQAQAIIADISVPSGIEVLRDEQAATMTLADFQGKCQHLRELRQQHQELIQRYGQVENHPWYGLTNHNLSLIEQGDLRAHAQMWLNSLNQLCREWQQIATVLGFAPELTLADIQTIQQQLGSCPASNDLVEMALLPVLKTIAICDAVTSLINQLRGLKLQKQNLIQFFQQRVLSSELRQFRSLLGQLQSSEDEVQRISSIIQNLRAQIPELCNPAHHALLIRAKETSDKLRSERTELSRSYNLNACRDSLQMLHYAGKLRQANLLSPLFDSEYRAARQLWGMIQKLPSQAQYSNIEIASVFQRIAQFQNELNQFASDYRLRQICGKFFNELDTDFNALTSINSFASELIEKFNKLESTKQSINTEAINRLGYFYQEENTDIERLEATTNFARSVIEAQLPQSIQEQLFTRDAAHTLERIRDASHRLSSCLANETRYRQAFFQLGNPDPQVMFGVQDVTRLRLEQVAECLNCLINASDDLPTWISYNRAYQQVTDDGMQPLVEAFKSDGLELDYLEKVYTVVFYRSLLRFAYQQYPELNQFSGITQAQAREQFQESDRQLLNLYQAQLAGQLANTPIEPGNRRGPRSQWTDLTLIQNEINKQRRHIPLRDLFERASVALQQLKPCWMMSPASVAQFIPPGAVTFDLVIIDEASQMRPEEALGAIARARQLVVVGDPKQLPPTDFFRSHIEQDIDEFSGEESDVLDDESILDMSLKVFYPARRLKWHYRSRHESLIAFSNQNFYDNSLTIFPSPNNNFAVDYQYVSTGAYRSGANVQEAMSVAQAAADFMRQYPDRSLGIVTLNQKQQELLLDEMDRLFALNPELEEYRLRRENSLEPFFVKNLENVQGDERDVIFISTVYGPERPGMPVMQRFGPINSRNGHRRLNVLFTRAKEQVVIFSSMRSSDIRPGPTSNRGVQILRDYLEYAQTQRLQTAVVTGREPESDFEVFVARRLRQHGYEVVPQVGVSGYFIDLAVLDPEQPDTYLLGIECDGATYHSAKAARDRDRLRQQVLEQLGWHLYRIWSTDWFINPNAETQKLITYLQRLRQLRSCLKS